MARKTQHSFAKRQRELKKAKKAEAKRAEKEARKNPPIEESEHSSEPSENEIETPPDPA